MGVRKKIKQKAHSLKEWMEGYSEITDEEEAWKFAKEKSLILDSDVLAVLDDAVIVDKAKWLEVVEYMKDRPFIDIFNLIDKPIPETILNKLEEMRKQNEAFFETLTNKLAELEKEA